MFDLEYKRLLKIDAGKSGGGIAATDSELLLVTGDGQLRIVDLDANDSVFEPTITLPETNEVSAISEANKAFPPKRAELAK